MVENNTENSTIQTVSKWVALHLKRLNLSTTPDQIKNILNLRFPEPECEMHEARRPDFYGSVKVSINQDHL